MFVRLQSGRVWGVGQWQREDTLVVVVVGRDTRARPDYVGRCQRERMWGHTLVAFVCRCLSQSWLPGTWNPNHECCPSSQASTIVFSLSLSLSLIRCHRQSSKQSLANTLLMFKTYSRHQTNRCYPTNLSMWCWPLGHSPHTLPTTTCLRSLLTTVSSSFPSFPLLSPSTTPTLNMFYRNFFKYLKKCIWSMSH